jgi:hypothetical protein
LGPQCLEVENLHVLEENGENSVEKTKFETLKFDEVHAFTNTDIEGISWTTYWN